MRRFRTLSLFNRFYWLYTMPTTGILSVLLASFFVCFINYLLPFFPPSLSGLVVFCFVKTTQISISMRLASWEKILLSYIGSFSFIFGISVSSHIPYLGSEASGILISYSTCPVLFSDIRRFAFFRSCAHFQWRKCVPMRLSSVVPRDTRI